MVEQASLRVALEDPVAEPAPVVGVLALQGDVREHLWAVREAGLAAAPVRTLDELNDVDALVMPGGESTTMDKLLRNFGLQSRLRERLIMGLPVLATCAGLILLARRVEDGLPDQESLGGCPSPCAGMPMAASRRASRRISRCAASIARSTASSSAPP